MHDLDELIAEWRKTAAPDVTTETLDELETHVRETVEQLARSGVAVPDAFPRAVAQLGTAPGIASEFQKLDQSLWLPIKITLGVAALGALLLAVALVNRFRLDLRPAHLLLGGHIFAVTLGYTITLLIGALGICFVCQRAFAKFSTSRLQSISRVSFVLTGIALLFTTLGVILGMVWAKGQWGRYWDWDTKEIGGFSVVVWLTCYLIAHRFFKGSARGVLAISTLGNIIVSVAWFGPHLLTSMHHYGTPNYSVLLLIALVANLSFFVVGFLPAGWLRRNRA